MVLRYHNHSHDLWQPASVLRLPGRGARPAGLITPGEEKRGMRIADCGMVVTEPQSAIPRSAFRNPRFEIRVSKSAKGYLFPRSQNLQLCLIRTCSWKNGFFLVRSCALYSQLHP